LVDRFNTLFSGQKLFLNTVPASLLPKGLRSIQAERASSVPQDIPDLEVVQEFERPENHSANADVMNPFANPAPPMPLDLHNEVEDIIMLAQGLPSLPPEGLSLKDRLADIEKDLMDDFDIYYGDNYKVKENGSKRMKTYPEKLSFSFFEKLQFYPLT
jgi:sigma-54 specific flagellar transcriptional regulator A